MPRHTATHFHSFVPCRAFWNEISLAPLLDIDRHDVECRFAKGVAVVIPLQNTVNNVLRMQVRLVDVCQGRPLVDAWFPMKSEP